MGRCIHLSLCQVVSEEPFQLWDELEAEFDFRSTIYRYREQTHSDQITHFCMKYGLALNLYCPEVQNFYLCGNFFVANARFRNLQNIMRIVSNFPPNFGKIFEHHVDLFKKIAPWGDRTRTS